MKINYSFTLPTLSSTPEVKPTEELVDYTYNEFLIRLPKHWRQVPTSEENSFNWYSEVDAASITISADFYQIPPEKEQLLAEKCLLSRFEALERVDPGKVTILSQGIKPHSGGVGLEINFNAEVPDKHVYLYLGYVTTRKIFNLTFVCKPDRAAAASLYNKTMESIRVKLP